MLNDFHISDSIDAVECWIFMIPNHKQSNKFVSHNFAKNVTVDSTTQFRRLIAQQTQMQTFLTTATLIKRIQWMYQKENKEKWQAKQTRTTSLGQKTFIRSCSKDRAVLVKSQPRWRSMISAEKLPSIGRGLYHLFRIFMWLWVTMISEMFDLNLNYI